MQLIFISLASNYLELGKLLPKIKIETGYRINLCIFFTLYKKKCNTNYILLDTD